MNRNAKIYRTETSAYRFDGMQVYLPTRAVFIDMFTKLSSCCFRVCPFYGLTCNKCHYSV